MFEKQIKSIFIIMLFCLPFFLLHSQKRGSLQQLDFNQQNQHTFITQKGIAVSLNSITIFQANNMTHTRKQFILEKVMISIGVIHFAVGIPLIVMGIINYITPYHNYSSITNDQAKYFTLTGSVIFGLGTTLFIPGVVSIGIKIRKRKKQMNKPKSDLSYSSQF
ncbi:MAG: hypothetical protein MJB14_12635 [Spirochaetes bacterium]|nr:hypothetical protein [Spirochaetota bacterium]